MGVRPGHRLRGGLGAFVLPIDWLQGAGLAGVVLGFGGSTVLILVVGLVYATAIRALPRTGGGVLFAVLSAGRIPGFIAGWSLALGYIGIIAMNASAVSLIFRVTFPGLLSHGKLLEVAGWEVYLAEVLVSILFIWVFALLNMKGVEFSGRFQFWAVVTMLTCIAVLGVSAVYAFLTKNIELPAAVPSGQSPLTSVVVILAIAPWALSSKVPLVRAWAAILRSPDLMDNPPLHGAGVGPPAGCRGRRTRMGGGLHLSDSTGSIRRCATPGRR